MALIPERFRDVHDVSSMLGALDAVVGGRTSARFAVMPADLDQAALSTDRTWHWDEWRVLLGDPYLALAVGRPESDQGAAGLPLDAPSVHDAPVLFVTIYGGCCILSSAAGSGVFRRLHQTFLREEYPSVGRGFLDTSMVFEVLEGVAADNCCSGFVVRGCSYRAPIDAAAEDGAWESDRKWTQRTLENASLYLAETKGWVRRIGFSFDWDEGEAGFCEAAGSLGRDAVVTATSAVPVVWEQVVLRSAAILSQEKETLQGRDRGNSYEFPLRPLKIRYGEPVFRDVAAAKFLVRQLRKLPDSSLSVYHGNPYLHVSLVDHLDGSSFAVWVVDAEEITILPGARASASAFGRLIGHVLDQFREGELIAHD
ncbi:hypothetical protein LLH03_03370 [bacterium]|nr:hypothetical protein [bacterium]